MRHLVYVPFTGLGLRNGFRGTPWLRNRIKIFKQFVVPSLKAQTTQNFTVWVSWRLEEVGNRDVFNLERYLVGIFGEDRVVFTYGGVCFWDDKYDEETARQRLMLALHHSTKQLVNYIGDVKDVIMTIQPSDDCYYSGAFEEIQTLFKSTDFDGVGYGMGYIINYQTKEVREYNPKTNPPFYSIRFKKEVFLDHYLHAQHTALKRDVGEYKKGTPCPSHEYVGDCVKYVQLPKRGFLVGTHGENISTHFNIPYAGDTVDCEILKNFGILDIPPLVISYALRKRIMRRLPHKVQRKLRYIFTEKLPKLLTFKKT